MDQNLINIGDHIAVLKRRWRILVLCAILGALAGFGLSMAQPTEYRVESRLLLEPEVQAVLNNGTLIGADEVATQADVVGSVEVANRVIDDLNLDTEPQDLLRTITVEVVDTKRVLSISTTQPTAERAAEIANAFADQYIEHRVESTTGGRDALRDSYEARRQRLTSAITRVQRQMRATVATDPSLDALMNQLQALLQERIEVTSLLGELDSEEARSGSGGQVLQRATPPNRPAAPRPVRGSVLAGIIGLMIGLGLAYVRDQFDDRVRDPGRLRNALAARPLLAVIPPSRDEGRGRVGTVLAPWSPLSEAFRTMNSNVRFLAAARDETERDRAAVVLVTSASPGEGKTAVCANLAVAAARSGLRVVLVDGDLRAPSVDGRFGVDVPIGLSDVLAEDLEVEPLLQDVGIEGLRILAAGTPPPNPAELLASPRTGRVIDQLRDVSDLVVVDSAPILRVADSLELVRIVDLIILVVKARSTRLRALADVIARVEQVGGNLSGAVLNHGDIGEVGYGYGERSVRATRNTVFRRMRLRFTRTGRKGPKTATTADPGTVPGTVVSTDGEIETDEAQVESRTPSR